LIAKGYLSIYAYNSNGAIVASMNEGREILDGLQKNSLLLVWQGVDMIHTSSIA